MVEVALFGNHTHTQFFLKVTITCPQMAKGFLEHHQGMCVCVCVTKDSTAASFDGWGESMAHHPRTKFPTSGATEHLGAARSSQKAKGRGTKHHHHQITCTIPP